MSETTHLPSARTLALVAFVCFAIVVASFAVAPGVWWSDYPGIVFHLAIFLLVPWLPAPQWAKASGYGWAIIDTAVGAMTLNGVPMEIAMPLRLGGHVFAGIWIAAASLSGSAPMKVIGCMAGAWLMVFTFTARFVPPIALMPSSILVLAWLAIIAWQDGNTRPSQAGI